jgi:hypothetical protein
MQAVHYLIDCEGRSLASPFKALRQALGYGDTEHALITHAVEKLGYLHVQEWPRGLIVFYRRPVTNPVTFAGAIYLLAGLPDRRVIFSVFDGRARYFLCRGRSQAIGRLAHEMRYVETAMLKTTRTASDVDLSAGPMRVKRSTK